LYFPFWVFSIAQKYSFADELVFATIRSLSLALDTGTRCRRVRPARLMASEAAE
jgi:hypothetical protein